MFEMLCRILPTSFEDVKLEEVLDRIFDEADIDDDGFIDYHEFKGIVSFVFLVLHSVSMIPWYSHYHRLSPSLCFLPLSSPSLFILSDTTISSVPLPLPHTK